MTTKIKAAVSALVLIAAATTPARAQFSDLIKRLPSGANSLILLNVEQMHKTPLAVKENWRERHEQQFSAGLILVPPQARRFVMAANFDFEYMQRTWEAAVMNVSYEPQLPKLAAAYNGGVETIASRPVAFLPGDVAVVKFSNNTAGVMLPAMRQSVGRWINRVYATTKTPAVAGYLEEAVKYAEKGAPLIIAMDFENALSPRMIRLKLDNMQSLKGHNVDLDKLAALLADIRGVMLGVTVGQRRFGSIRVDFKRDAAMMAPYAKELLLEVLGNQGAMIEEFGDWTLKMEGNTVRISGPLFESGMRRILSLMDAPPTLQVKEKPEAVSDEKVMALATKQYFGAIESYLKDLRRKRGSDRRTTFGQVAMWFERYARRIDGLSTLNVDPEMIQYSNFVADQLRQSQSALQGIGYRKGYRQTQTANQYTTYGYGEAIGVTRWGAYGQYGYVTQEDLRGKGQIQAQIRTQERIKGNSQANIIMQGIDRATRDVRQNMTKKYGSDF